MQLFNKSSKARARTTGRPRSTAKSPNGVHFLLARLGSKMAGDGSGSVVAFTSTNSGEGVSHVVRVLAGQLAAQTGRPTLIVQAESLAQLSPAELLKLSARCVPTNIANLWVLPKAQSPNGNGNKPLDAAEASRPDTSRGLDVLRTLRAVFAHTLIDCPAIGASHEATVLAPNVDGVVLVVQADRTKRDQILRVRQTIEMAQGELMALVLNKRRHVVPDWLYRML
jgi:Mrp family chromosome partitioning ATPase